MVTVPVTAGCVVTVGVLVATGVWVGCVVFVGVFVGVVVVTGVAVMVGVLVAVAVGAGVLVGMFVGLTVGVAVATFGVFVAKAVEVGFWVATTGVEVDVVVVFFFPHIVKSLRTFNKLGFPSLFKEKTK